MDAYPMRWIVALPAEADPVIERFALQPDRTRSRGRLRVYQSVDDRVRLGVSGIGTTNAAAATAWLAAHESRESPKLWINFGIAGGEGTRGTVRRASRVIDDATGRSWYPPAVWARQADLPETTVRSVTGPRTDYATDGELFEMEAAGFCPTATRFASSELVQVVKVVSDGPDGRIEDIDARLVQRLCGEALQTMMPWLEAMSPLIAEEGARLADPPGFAEWLERFRFTETQRHQLRRLLEQGESRSPGDSPFRGWLQEPWADASALLKGMRERLWCDRNPGSLGKGM